MKYFSKFIFLIFILAFSISCAIPQEISQYLFTSTPSVVPTITNTPPASLTPFQPATKTSTPEPTLTPTSTTTEIPTLTATETATGTQTVIPSMTFTQSPPPSSTFSIAPSQTNVFRPSSTRTRTCTLTKPATVAVTLTGTATTIPLLTATTTLTGTTVTPGVTTSTAPTSSPLPSNTPRANCSGMTPNSDYTSLIFSLVNQARTDNGLPALNWNNRLAAAAAEHSLDMACNSFVNHTGSDGSRASDRVRAQGYSFQWVGENIYGGWGSYGDPNNVFTWWMNSQAHRDNILGVYYKDAGVGYYLNPETGRGYFTLVFGVTK